MAALCNISLVGRRLLISLNYTQLSSNTASRARELYCNVHFPRLCSSLGSNSFVQRTHTCGELNDWHIGKEVTLCGWIEFKRLSLFLTLRDGYGRTQLVIPEEMKSSLGQLVEKLPLESVIKVKGRVICRPENQFNLEMETGKIEVLTNNIEVLNRCVAKLPFNIRKFHKANEALRLKHRYLDLRNQQMQHNLRLRSKITMLIRDFLCNKHGFIDVETPTLFRQTPGGAREFIVPTKKKNKYYSLTQSPQQFKQLLMIGSMDRYFQIAHCYRDEATKSDRQPEFMQVDIEMSFITKSDIQNLIEGLFKHLFSGISKQIILPFPRITYKEAMERYGSDKPDLRKTNDPSELAFVWVEDFPMFFPSEEDPGKLESAHHPFTAPHVEDAHLLETDPSKARSQHYDLVLNGQEIGGGSIRLHNSKVQKYIFKEILKEDCTQLHHLFDALDIGCPPHGGIALGLDRLVAILCGMENIRDVIAFPKSLEGKDLMSGAPTNVSNESLSYYNQRIKEIE